MQLKICITINNGIKKSYKITSVHLLGAAVDNEEIAKNPLYIVKNPPLNYSQINDSNPIKRLEVLKNLTESYNPYGTNQLLEMR